MKPTFTLFGTHALLDSPGELTLLRQEDAAVLARWPRPPPSPPRRSTSLDEPASPDGAEADDAPDPMIDFDRFVTQFVTDARTDRVALLWQRGFIDGEPDLTPRLFSAEVEIIDPPRKRSFFLKEPASQTSELVGFSPRGDLFVDSQPTGLASYAAWHPAAAGAEDELMHAMGELMQAMGLDDSPSLGHLVHALGFHALPHCQQLVFREDGHRALSGSWSQYASHLALLDLLGPPKVLARENIEVWHIAARPGFREALVLETGYRGVDRVSLWQTEPLERLEDLHLVGPYGEPTVHDAWVDPDVSRAVILTTDGFATTLERGRADRNRFPLRDEVPFGEEVTRADLAVNFEAGRIACRDKERLRVLDFEGTVITTLGGVDAVTADQEGFLLTRANELHRVGRDGRTSCLFQASSPIVAFAPAPTGILIADASGAQRLARPST